MIMYQRQEPHFSSRSVPAMSRFHILKEYNIGRTRFTVILAINSSCMELILLPTGHMLGLKL